MFYRFIKASRRIAKNGSHRVWMKAPCVKSIWRSGKVAGYKPQYSSYFSEVLAMNALETSHMMQTFVIATVCTLDSNCMTLLLKSLLISVAINIEIKLGLNFSQLIGIHNARKYCIGCGGRISSSSFSYQHEKARCVWLCNSGATVQGTTNYCVIVFKACSIGKNLCFILQGKAKYCGRDSKRPQWGDDCCPFIK